MKYESRIVNTELTHLSTGFSLLANTPFDFTHGLSAVERLKRGLEGFAKVLMNSKFQLTHDS